MDEVCLVLFVLKAAVELSSLAFLFLVVDDFCDDAFKMRGGFC